MKSLGSRRVAIPGQRDFLPCQSPEKKEREGRKEGETWTTFISTDLLLSLFLSYHREAHLNQTLLLYTESILHN